MVKKVAAFVLTIIWMWSLSGCRNRTMNDIIANEPSITGIVTETREQSILMETDEKTYQVSLKVENNDSITHFQIGDEIVVYYDGMISESEPMQINTVYAITLKTPASRSENNRS